jgi:hypothetical protein
MAWDVTPPAGRIYVSINDRRTYHRFELSFIWGWHGQVVRGLPVPAADDHGQVRYDLPYAAPLLHFLDSIAALARRGERVARDGCDEGW